MRSPEEVSSPKGESQKELVWLSCYLPENDAHPKMVEWRDGKNMGLHWLKLLIQLTLKLSLQQDFHLCDRKFSCLSLWVGVSITCSWKHPHWWTILKKNDSCGNNPPSFWLTLASRDNYLGHQIHKKYGGHKITIIVVTFRERIGIVSGRGSERGFWNASVISIRVVVTWVCVL